VSYEDGRCTFCGETCSRLTRQRKVGSERASRFSYQHHFWRCSGCGREWEDESMRRLNEANSSLFRGLRGIRRALH
jgi:uncharacterized protein with PIN domain